jgi:hypothetical protein
MEYILKYERFKKINYQPCIFKKWKNNIKEKPNKEVIT